MKIVWLASWYPNRLRPFDGDFIQRHARALAGYHAVTVFHVTQSPSDREPYFSDSMNDGVREIICGVSIRKSGTSFWKKLLFNWQYYRTYRRLIRSYVEKEGIPDLVHVHIPLKAGMVARWMKWKWKVPYVVTEHSTHYLAESGDNFFKKPWLHRRQVAAVFREAGLVTNVSRFFADKLKQIFMLDRVEVIPNTVNTALFRYDGSQAAPFRFIHVSTLFEHQKNVRGILRAVARLAVERQDFEVEVVGPASAGLLAFVHEAGISRYIIFSGEIPYDEVASQMGQASAFLLFSRYENFPCVIIEALCSGLPVIAADVGGVGEAIEPSNGILIQPGDEDQLANAMNRMMNDYTRFDPAAIAAKARAAWGYETIGRKLAEMYSSLMGSKYEHAE